METAVYSLIAVVLALVFASLLYFLFNLLQTLRQIKQKLARMVKVGDFFTKNGPKMIKFMSNMDEIMAGGNKINEDSVKINQKMVEEFAKMRELVETLKAVMFSSDEGHQRGIQEVQKDYDYSYDQLVRDGIDPDRAKQYAAEAEYEAIYREGVGPHIGIGS